MLGLFMVLPVLPLLVDEIAESTPFLIGIALGVYGLSQALLQIPLGQLSDRFGRKVIIAGGLVIFIIGSLVAALSENIYGIILGRFLQGCGAIASTLLALVSDVTREDNRSKAMAIVGMSIGASFGVSLVLGPWINGIFGIKGIFLGTALAGVLGLAILIFVVPTPVSRHLDPQTHLDINRLRGVLGQRGLGITTLGIFILHFLLMSSFVVFPSLMQGTGEIATTDHHFIYLSILIITFVLMGPFMWLSDKAGYGKILMLVMILCFIAASGILSQLRAYYPVLGAMVLFFMAFNLLEVILPSLVSKLAPAGSRGTAMGVYSTAQFAGAFMGGAVGGYIIQSWDIADLMYVNIGICLLWFVVGLGLPNTGNNKSMTFSLSGFGQASDKKILDALLSVEGVIEAAIIDSEGPGDREFAYLKVDADHLDTEALERLKEH